MKQLLLYSTASLSTSSTTDHQTNPSFLNWGSWVVGWWKTAGCILCWQDTKPPQCFWEVFHLYVCWDHKKCDESWCVRGAGSEWHGVAASAAVHWPTKCRPSPQCEVLLCCHHPQKPDTRSGGCFWALQGFSAVRLPSTLQRDACSVRWTKRILYCNESICILVC